MSHGFITALRPIWRSFTPRQRYLIKLPSYLAEITQRSFGGARCYCACCGGTDRFLPSGHPPRYNSLCPNCGSQERHRLFAIALDRMPLIAPGDRVLHFAPEDLLAKLVKARTANYLAADVQAGRGDVVRDMEAISDADGAYDVLIANHVLEHVDDSRALSEIHRVLKPSGRLIFTIPLAEGWDQTYENPAIVEPKARDLHFGQWDHVRFYGRDVRDRIRAAGFVLEEFAGTGAEVVQHGLLRGERIFVAHKNARARRPPPGPLGAIVKLRTVTPRQ